MRRALAIAAKDLRLRIRDRSAFIIGFLVPFGLAGIFSLTLSNVDDEERFSVTFAIVDRDGGELAATFDRTIRSLGFVEVRDATSPGEAERLAEDGDVDAAFVVPEGFSAGVSAGRGGEIRVVANPSSEVGGLIARSLAQGFANDLDAVQLAVATAIVSGAEDQAPALAERAHAIPPAAELDRNTAASRVLSGTTFYAIGMAVFFVFFTVEFGVRSLLDERQGGTLGRLLVAPLRPSWLVAGKVLAGFVVGLVSMSALVAATTLLLNAEWGTLPGVGLMVLLGVASAVAVTALVATLATTPAQAAGYTSLVTVVLGLFGGTFFPISQASFLSGLSLLAPQAWMMRGFQDLASGSGIAGVWPSLLALLTFSGVLGGIALVRARRMVLR